MSLLLVPYTNAMRLGQGFNSYTQQICVDDAVVINNDRAENTLLNDGTTMRILIQSQAKPSAWTRQKEVVVDDRTIGLVKEPLQRLPEDELHVKSDETSPKVVEKSVDAIVKDQETQPKTKPKDEEIQPKTKPKDEVDQEAPASAEDEESLDEDSGTEENSSPVMVEGAESTKEIASKVKKTPASSTPAKDPAPKVRVRSVSTGSSRPVATPTKQPVASTSQDKKSDGWQKLQASLAARKAAQVKADEEDLEALRKAEKKRIADERKYQEEVEKETRAEDRVRRAEERAEQRKIREEKRKFEDERRTAMYQSIKDAAAAKGQAMSMADMQAILKQNQFAERWNGMGENGQDIVFDATGPRGPSQTVTYTSRFVDRLSDITDDMCISGALSIKAAKIGGSGRGSFIDSDKFKSSDLTFYISVKVINQTINFKDALEYKPMSSVTNENFASVYGDSFISGFLEGGEFNAVVSMKILNKAKKTDIQAEAKVAFTAGPMSVEAEANVGIARENLDTNTETTIQVSWCGGGHIKPMEQQWDIKSLMAAAARFPDLVAECPQRTYAILTKYDNLRSFVARKPAAYSKLQYENAQIYTNVLMDAFMSYKALYKKISDQMFQVGQKTMEIVSWEKKDEDDKAGNSNTTPPSKPASTTKQDGFYSHVEDDSRFEASLGGLDRARKAIRRQMTRIVNEVDIIEKNPKLATDEDHEEPFQGPTQFEMRLPTVEIPQRLRPSRQPLSGHRIVPKARSEEERERQAKSMDDAPGLYDESEVMTPEEADSFAKCLELNPYLGEHLQVTGAIGGTDSSVSFNLLDYIREDWHIKKIVFRFGKGQLRSLTVDYENGLQVFQGVSDTDMITFEFDSFQQGERIITCVLESGIWTGDKADKHRILGVKLYTNRGRSLLAQSKESKPTGDHSAMRSGFEYRDISVTAIECPLKQGTLKGFFGRCNTQGVIRLGLIWGDILPEVPAATASDTPKVERRILPSKWGHTSTTDYKTHTANFGIEYNAPPKVLFALSDVKGLNKNPLPFSWDQESEAIITKTGFTYKTKHGGNNKMTDLSYSWLTLPDNEVNWNCGTHDFDAEINDNLENAKGTYQVTFAKPYKTIPATPAIWCITSDFTDNGPNLKQQGRVRGKVEDLTTTGFKLVVETWDGGKHAGNVWGWCVWDKEYDGVKVKSGSAVQTKTEYTSDSSWNWKPFSGGKTPVSIMTGMRGFDVDVSDGGHFNIRSRWQGDLESGCLYSGIDITAKIKYIDIMYLAIMEN